MTENTKRFLFMALAATSFAGCANNPHPPPLHQTKADGSPWLVGYRALGDDPRTLDPQVSYDTLGHAVISQFYECLLQYHPFKTDPYELIPCLAAEMPQRIKHGDGRESYLFKLKQGLYFHDDPCFEATHGIGREVTAEDVAHAFKRIADPKVECPVLSTLQDYVAGLKEAYEEARKTGQFDYSKPLSGIEVIDRHTFQIHLLKPYPQILYWLAMPFSSPVPREAVQYYDGKVHEGVSRSQFKFHPVGTGPFQLVEWQRGRLIRLARHERYMATTFPTEGWPPSEESRFRPVAGKRIPFLDEVQFPIISERVPRFLLFRQGYVDTFIISKDVFSAVLNVSMQLTPKYHERGIQLNKDTEPSTFSLLFNMEDPVVGKSRKLRQAISSAYNQSLGNEIFFNGMYLDAQQLLPPGVFGRQLNFQNPYRQQNLTLAKRLLAEAGYPEGCDVRTGNQLELTLDMVADDAEARQMAEFEKNQIEHLGIRVKVEENIWSRLQEKKIAGHFQMVSGSGWHADYPDPENFFFLFCSRNIPPQGSNDTRYRNPKFDEVFERMSTMDNTPERMELVRQLNDILTEDCPWVLNSHPVYFALNQPWCPRVSSNPLLAGGLKYVSVNIALREQKQKEWNHTSLWPLAVVSGFLILAAGSGIHWSRKRYV